jgi:hypothetical protein
MIFYTLLARMYTTALQQLARTIYNSTQEAVPKVRAGKKEKENP